MSLLWPTLLLGLLILPLVTAFYIYILRRRRRYTVRFSSLSLVRQALPRRTWLRRHIPFALFLLAFASLIVAAAQPVYQVHVPIYQATVILAIDVSRSMRQRDIWPTRLDAAKDAALSFINNQDPSIQIGVVAFSGFAEVVIPPTKDKVKLRSAVQSLTLGRGTAIGSGLQKSVDLINKMVSPIPTTGQVPQSELPVGGNAPYIIVLLTDGVNTTGTDPVEVAKNAVKIGIRTYTIGFGQPIAGENLQSTQTSDAGSSGGEPSSRVYFRHGLDEETLRKVAEMTGGKYYTAESASELADVFSSLPTSLMTGSEVSEVSAIFAAVGALLAAIAVTLSILWHPLL